MYHEQFSGTHYEIGFHWGSCLAKHGDYLLDTIGFPMTSERMRFSSDCVPIYQSYFPEIIEEIHGIAEGQQCDFETLQAFLFSMYAMPPMCRCSCFAVSNNSQILFGRNSDFLTELEDSNRNVIYRFPSNSYAFTGNTTAFVEIEDGLNEHGLAVGLTSIYPQNIRPGMNAGLLLRFFLEKCRTAAEVISAVKTLPISSAQTFTVADSTGEIAVVECDCDEIAVIYPTESSSYVCATNLFHTDSLSRKNCPAIDNWNADLRYRTLTSFLHLHCADLVPEDAANLLSGKHGFLCQYDRMTGKDTVWSVIYNLTSHQILRAEANPSQHPFIEDTRFPWELTSAGQSR